MTSFKIFFSCRGWSDLGKISQTGAEWHIDCGDVVEIETRCRITIWRTWANSMACHPRATYHIAGCCHLMNSLPWFESHMPHCRVQSPGEINVDVVPVFGFRRNRLSYEMVECRLFPYLRTRTRRDRSTLAPVSPVNPVAPGIGGGVVVFDLPPWGINASFLQSTSTAPVVLVLSPVHRYRELVYFATANHYCRTSCPLF